MNITEITGTKRQSDEPTRLAAYCRVSSDLADQLHSFAAQIRYYSEYVKKHPECRNRINKLLPGHHRLDAPVLRAADIEAGFTQPLIILKVS